MFAFFDQALFSLINGHLRHPVLDTILPLFSDTWILVVALLALLGFFALYRRKMYGEALWRVLVLALFLALSVGATDVFCNIVKDSTGRFRPFQSVEGSHFFSPERTWVVMENIPSPPPGTRGDSFPSAHAANSMAVALVISLLFRKSNPWIYLLPFMVGWSRIYLGRHYPLDVGMGWIMGFFSVLAVWWLCNFVFSFFSSQKNLSPKQ